jgi:hypothetical protein
MYYALSGLIFNLFHDTGLHPVLMYYALSGLIFNLFHDTGLHPVLISCALSGLIFNLFHDTGLHPVLISCALSELIFKIGIICFVFSIESLSILIKELKMKSGKKWKSGLIHYFCKKYFAHEHY